MTISVLVSAQKAVETEFNNLNDSTWLATRLSYLKGAYDILNNLIQQESSHATDKPVKKSNSNNNKVK